MELTDEDRALMSAEEIAALSAENADALLGMHGAATDPDEAAAAPPPAPAPGPAPAPAAEVPAPAEAAPADGAPADEDAIDVAALAAIAQDGNQAPPPKPVVYEADATDFTKQRKDIKVERRTLEQEWSEGKHTDEERIEKLEAINDRLDDLNRAEATATAIRTISEQNVKQAQATRDAQMNDAVQGILAAALKPEGGAVDYVKDRSAAAQFDVFLTALEADPANTNLSAAQLADRAHRGVLAIRGIQPTAAAPAPAPTPAAPAAAPVPKPLRQVPTTLSGLPNAGDAEIGQDLVSKFERLEGDEAEAFLAGLPPATVAQLMKFADSNFAGRSH